MRALKLVENLRDFAGAGVFNPYKDVCPQHDKSEAAAIRSLSLLNLIEAAAGNCDDLWIGRDLGHKGGRRTGLALTDDNHLPAHLSRWGLESHIPVKHPNVSEVTAKVIWGELDRISAKVFLWNVFPFHPHQPNQPFTNRTHTASEREVGLSILSDLIAVLKPKRLMPIGQDALKACDSVNHDCTVYPLRHPSYGGANIYRRQVQDLYNLRPTEPKGSLL